MLWAKATPLGGRGADGRRGGAEHPRLLRAVHVHLRGVHGPGHGRDDGHRRDGHGERSRSELHFKLGGTVTENLSILAGNALAVNVLAVNSVSQGVS